MFTLTNTHDRASPVPPPMILRYRSLFVVMATFIVVIMTTFDVNTLQTADAQAFVSVCDRQAAIRDAIVAALSSRSDCAAVQRWDLSSIRTLNLNNANISSISADDYNGLRPERLSLIGNNLTAIPPAIINQYLHRLDLRDNNITRVNENDLAGAPQLRYLRLRGNDLSAANALHQDALDPLTELETLNINNAGLKSLPTGFIDELTDLDRFEIANNEITAIDPDFFQHNTQLRTLYVYGNNLTTIDKRWLRTLSRLSAFWINDNKITTLNANAFTTTTDGQTYTGPTRLGTLYLHNNEIATIHPDAFNGLNLWTLRLDGNNIASLPSDVFDDMPRIADLRLYGNQLTSIEAGTFENQTNLRNLYLNRNRLRSIDADIFKNLTRLSYLQIDNNQISTIHADAFANLRQLSLLLMNNNRLTQLPTTLFRANTALTLLRIQSNQITEIDANVFRGLENLRDLWLHRNQIHTIQPNAFEGLDTLSQLLLYSNRLDEIDVTVFSGIPNLRQLWLHGNRIQTIHANAFAGLDNLSQLLLHGNQIKFLPLGVFRGLDLDMLWLTTNPGAPFRLPVRTDFGASNNAHISILHGAVFDVNIRISGARTTSTTVPAGSTQSPTFDLNPTTGEEPEVSISLSSAPTTRCYGSACFRGFQYAATDGPYPRLPVISRIEPQIVGATVETGQQVRLTANVFNMQGRNANDPFDQRTGRFDDNQLGFVWSYDISGGTFNTANTPRTIYYTAPETPSTVIITAEANPYGVCRGHHTTPANNSDCIATFTIRVVPAGNTQAPAESDPKNPSGQIPTSLSDSSGVEYEVATPEQGGRYQAEDCETCPTVTIPIGAVPDLTVIGIRASDQSSTSQNPLLSDQLVISSDYTSVTAVNQRGEPLTNYTLNKPMQICLPLPAQFRSRLDGIALFEFADEPTDSRMLSAKVYARNGNLTMCALTDRLPTTVAPARRGTVEPTLTQPSTSDNLPETGGAAPNPLAPLAAAIAGMLLTAIGLIYHCLSARHRGCSSVGRALRSQ